MAYKPRHFKGDGHKHKRIKPHYVRQMENFKRDITWRIFRIMSEFVDGFDFIAKLHKDVTFFGSARLPETHPDYQSARKLAFMLSKAGFTIITGGGPGIMEAANRGAYEAGGESAGLNIQLPKEQRINPYVKKSVAFHFFFTRKVALTASSRAYVYYSGGFGTLDEFFEIVTLIQTRKMERIPIVCVGKKFWDPIINGVVKKLLLDEYATISPEDMDLFKVVDTAEEAYEILKDVPRRKYF